MTFSALPAAFQGQWHPIRAELDGELAPALALQDISLTLTTDRYVVRLQNVIEDEGSCLHGTADDVIQLELKGRKGRNAGRTIPAIAQLRGDRLRICYGLDGTRPDAFAAGASSQRYLVVYRRG